MPTLIPLSIILFSIAVPLTFATRAAPRRTLRRIQILTVVMVLAWTFMCLTWYPQLVPVE